MTWPSRTFFAASLSEYTIPYMYHSRNLVNYALKYKYNTIVRSLDISFLPEFENMCVGEIKV